MLKWLNEKMKNEGESMKRIGMTLLLVAAVLFAAAPSFAGKCNKKKIQDTVESVEKSLGCAGVGLAFGGACEAGTLGLGTPGCIAGGIVLDVSCDFLGFDYVHKEAGAMAGDICDVAGSVDDMPSIVVQNKLKKHEIDFQVEITGGDNVHMRGKNWLKPGRSGVLASYKMDGKSYEVKARVKKDGGDAHLEIKHVKPGVHVVYVEHKDGKYRIHKEEIKKKHHKKS